MPEMGLPVMLRTLSMPAAQHAKASTGSSSWAWFGSGHGAGVMVQVRVHEPT